MFLDESYYFDVPFFNQKLKRSTSLPSPIVLTQFRIISSDNNDFALDELTKTPKSWQNFTEHKLRWTARTVLRDWDMLTEESKITLARDIGIEYLDSLRLEVQRGEVQVALYGYLKKIPQFLNSKHAPFAFRVQALRLNDEDKREAANLSDKLCVNPLRYYIVKSLHVSTFEKSQKFLHQYRVQHFIEEICKKCRISKADRVGIERLVLEYKKIWLDAAKLGWVTGAPPKDCNVHHYLALIIENLIEWSSHSRSSRVPISIWKDYNQKVVHALQEARKVGIRWGIYPSSGIGKADPHIQADDSHEPFMNSDLHPGGTDVEGHDTSEAAWPPSPTASHLAYFDDLFLEADPIWPELPQGIKVPLEIPPSLLWKCLLSEASSTSSLPCLFEIYLKKPSERLRSWLTEEQKEYLWPDDGRPKWNKRSPKLHSILVSLISHHFAEDHLEKSGIYGSKSDAGFRRI